jgi:hypothetical protein
MNESFGRTAGPTTEEGAPGEPVAHEPQPDPLDRARDVQPASRGLADTLLSDPDARPRNVDPLDPRRPGRPTDDPLDPDGHVI